VTCDAPTTMMGPILWENFKCSPASWSAKLKDFISGLPNHSMGQRIYKLLMEAFYEDQEGMYLRSHSALCEAEELLLEVGALESFILAMGGWRPADPGDDTPRPTPSPTPSTGQDCNPCSGDTGEQCAQGICFYLICQSCSRM